MTRHERLKKRAEEDPFEMLFGQRATSSAWYPWDWSTNSCKTAKESNAPRPAEYQPIQTNTLENASTSPRDTTGSEKHSKAASQSVHAPSSEEYVYDPISMRRIPKSVQGGANSSSDEQLPQKTPTFEKQSTPEIPFSSITKTTPSLTKREKNTIESSLDRHLRQVASPGESLAEPNNKKPLTKREAESSEEVDSLRADEIRAAFTKLKEEFSRKDKTLQEQTDRRRQSMQEAFERRMKETELQFTREIAKYITIPDGQKPVFNHHHQSSPGEKQTFSALTPEIQKDIEDHVREAEMRHARQEEEKTNALATQMRKKQKVDAKLTLEIEAQKASMDSYESRRSQSSTSDPTPLSAELGEGDLSAQVLKYAAGERWYKKKAPHALARERELLAKREEQKAKDRALIRELREIYESAYGTIDTKHRQGHKFETRGCDVNNGAALKYPKLEGESLDAQLLVSAQSSAILDKSEQLVPENNKTQPHQQGANAQLSSIAPFSHPLHGPLGSPRRFESCLKQAWRVETKDWAILKLMQGLYHEAPPRFDKARASRILARYIETAGQVQAYVLALTLSEFESKRLHMWHRLVHSRSNPEKALSKRRILDDLLGSSRKETPDKYETTLQSKEKLSHDSPFKTEKQIYKVLALRFDTHEVTSATTTSSLYESSTPPKSAASILSHLNHPASFIPHIEALQHSNFELVAGSRNMLVYKQLPSEHGQKSIIEPSPSLAQDLAKDASCSQRQSEEVEPIKTSSASEATSAQTHKSTSQEPNSPNGSNIRITVNCPSGGTVRINSISAGGPEKPPKNISSTAADCQDGKGTLTAPTAQPPEPINPKLQQPASVEQSSPPHEDRDETSQKPCANERPIRDACASQQRRRRGSFRKRLKSFAVRSFLLGGLCYVAGCFSVWYQKRKEALEQAEKKWVSSLSARKW